VTLLAVGHGTRDPAGVATIHALLDRVRALRPGLTVAESYAEITEPSLEDVMARLATTGPAGPLVAVPLMLGRGHHSSADIPGRIGRRAVVAPPLGPHALLARALADRLGDAHPADAFVLGAAGTSDPTGMADVRAAARLLGRHLGRRVAVASYLLAPGFFHRRVLSAGADLVSPPIGVHDALARLILRRYDETALAAGGVGKTQQSAYCSA
jgi:sirohydrochlorin ferrochelatase